MFFGAARLGLFDANNIGGKAYFGGGYAGSAALTSIRTYNLISGAAATGTAFTTARYTHGAFGNGTSGYQCGGYNTARTNTVRSFVFSTDINNSWTWTNTTLLVGMNECRGSSSAVKGYLWGGFTTSYNKWNYQLTYSSGSWASSTLLNWAVNTSYPGCHANSTTAIIIGGNNSSTNAPLNQRLLYTFATEANVHSTSTAYETLTQFSATGDQSYMWTIGGRQTTSYTANSTAVTKYAIVTGAFSLVRSLTSGAVTNQTDAAGNDYLGIFVGRWTGTTGGAAANTEQAQDYASDATTLLGSFLIGNNIYSANTEGMGAFSSVQIS